MYTMVTNMINSINDIENEYYVELIDDLGKMFKSFAEVDQQCDDPEQTYYDLVYALINQI